MNIAASVNHARQSRVDRSLCIGVAQGDVARVQAALDQGADPNVEFLVADTVYLMRGLRALAHPPGTAVPGGTRMVTPLGLAVEQGGALVELLLMAGGNPWLPGVGPASGSRTCPAVVAAAQNISKALEAFQLHDGVMRLRYSALGNSGRVAVDAALTDVSDVSAAQISAFIRGGHEVGLGRAARP